MIINDLGFESFAKPWLGSMSTALPTLVFINLWRWVGFPAIIFLAGLNAINQEYLEAARIDGASEGQIFRKIMFPLLAPSMTIITILTFIGAYEWFDLPFVIGGSNGFIGFLLGRSTQTQMKWASVQLLVFLSS
jgi:raffinose/stachyose/melibiose transport system permease protein